MVELSCSINLTVLTLNCTNVFYQANFQFRSSRLVWVLIDWQFHSSSLFNSQYVQENINVKVTFFTNPKHREGPPFELVVSLLVSDFLTLDTLYYYMGHPVYFRKQNQTQAPIPSKTAPCRGYGAYKSWRFD